MKDDNKETEVIYKKNYTDKFFSDYFLYTLYVIVPASCACFAIIQGVYDDWCVSIVAVIAIIFLLFKVIRFFLRIGDKKGQLYAKKVKITTESIVFWLDDFFSQDKKLEFRWEDVESVTLLDCLSLKCKNDSRVLYFSFPYFEREKSLSNTKLSAWSRYMDCANYAVFVHTVLRDTAFSKFLLSIRCYKLPMASYAMLYWLHLLCKLNPAALENQLQIIEANGYFYDNTLLVEDDGIGVEDAATFFSNLNIKEKAPFLDELFQLAITVDGIKNDEWYLLQRIITALGYNQRWKEYFVRRYGSLRTEADYQEQTSSSMAQPATTNALKYYYDMLALPADADYTQLQNAYHKLALEYHPDLPKNATRKEECEGRLAMINEAYEALSKNISRN